MPGFIENLITQNSFYPVFIKRSSLKGGIIFIFYIAKKLNIHGLLSPYLHTMCFFSVGEPFSRAVFLSRWFNNLSFNCAVEFWVSTLLWHLRAEWNKQKLCKVSSLLDLCTSDIWKWDHCHVASLSKDSNWWIFHPSCLPNLSCLHTDVHCIYNTVLACVAFPVQRGWIVHHNVSHYAALWSFVCLTK